MSDLSLSRRTRIVCSAAILNVPSGAPSSIAWTSILVSRNGTASGKRSRCMATSKQSPKSTWLCRRRYCPVKSATHDLTRHTIDEQVGRMAIAQTNDMADHAHHRERACKVGPSLEPGFAIRALEPEDATACVRRALRTYALEILTGRCVRQQSAKLGHALFSIACSKISTFCIVIRRSYLRASMRSLCARTCCRGQA